MSYIFALIGFIIGCAIGFLIGKNASRKPDARLQQLESDYRQLAAEKEKLAFQVGQLGQFEDRFKVIASEVLTDQKNAFKADFEDRSQTIDKTVKDLHGKIDLLEKERSNQVSALGTNVKSVLETAQRMETGAQRLEAALSSSGGVRGEWGEAKLESLLKDCGFTEGVDYLVQKTIAGEEGANLRPDVIVNLPGGLQLAIDSKAVWSEYLKAVGATSEDEKKVHISRLVQDMRRHIQSLSSKEYSKHLDRRIPYVIMFVPGEAAVRAAFDQDPNLFHDAQRNQILIASPATIIPVILLIKHAWKQHKSNENAVRLASEISELGSRLKTFFGHVAGMGSSLAAANKRFNEAVGSWDTRISPKLEQINTLGGNLQIGDGLEPIEIEPRVSNKLTDGGGEPAS